MNGPVYCHQTDLTDVETGRLKSVICLECGRKWVKSGRGELGYYLKTRKRTMGARFDRQREFERHAGDGVKYLRGYCSRLDAGVLCEVDGEQRQFVVKMMQAGMAGKFEAMRKLGEHAAAQRVEAVARKLTPAQAREALARWAVRPGRSQAKIDALNQRGGHDG